MRATITVQDAPEAGEGAKKIVLECRHGTTTGLLMPGALHSGEDDIIRLIILRHHEAERCRCTRWLSTNRDLWAQVTATAPTEGVCHNGTATRAIVRPPDRVR